MQMRFRTVQQKLIVYAFVLCISSMGAVGILTYAIARKQVQVDREQLMEVFARQLSQDISRELNAAAQDVLSWAESDFAINPDPGRMYAQRSYDLFLVLDTAGRIRAASGVGEPLIGQHYSRVLSGVPAEWHTRMLRSRRVAGIPWIRLNDLNRLHKRGEAAPVETKYQAVLAGPILSRDLGASSGIVIAILNWSQIQRVLDSAEERFRGIGLSTGYAFLEASNGTTTIGHKYRNLYGTDLVKDHNLPELYERLKSNPTGTIRYRWREGWKIVAVEKIESAGLGQEFEWYLGVGINESDIFAPVGNLLFWFLVVSSGTAVAMALVTSVVGRKLSVSLQEFAQLARDAARGRFSQLVRARTDDEIGDLAQAFNEMLVSFRAQIPFTQIPNPYVVGNPIRTAKMFFGRDDDLQWISQQLAREGNKVLVLFGSRRIGKTSLLHQIAAKHAALNITPFFFDTQQILPEVVQDADFYHVLTREMISQLPTVVPGVRTPFISTERFTPETMRRLIRFLREAQPAQIPVLLFDELENLEYKFARGALSRDLLLFFAALLDGDTPVSFIATGSDQLESLKSEHWKILIPKAIPQRIGLLTYQQAMRLIVEPMRGYVLFDDNVPEAILRLTGCHPYYTQVICQSLVDYLNLKREFAFGLQDLNEVIDQVLNNPPPPLNHVWESFTPAQKIVASCLAHALSDGETFLTPEQILESIPKELPSDIPGSSALRGPLNQLMHDDWIESRALGYRYKIDLFRLWLRREHSVWQLAEELQRSCSS